MTAISTAFVTINGANCTDHGSHIVLQVRGEDGNDTNIVFTPEQCSKLVASVSSAFAKARLLSGDQERRIPIPTERWEVGLIKGPYLVWSFLLSGGMHLSFRVGTSQIRPMQAELKRLEGKAPHLVAAPPKPQ